MTLRGWNTSHGRTSGGTSSSGASSRSMAPGQQGRESSSSSGVEPFVDLLDFGSSVVVNEDIIRVIGGEVHEIEESISVIDGESKKEETVERQLRQDLSYSHSEMTNLSRGASDQLESVNVHSTFIRGLENTLYADLVVSSGIRGTAAAAVVSPLPPSRARAGNRAEEGSNQESSLSSPAESSVYKDLIKERNEKLKETTASMKVTAKEVDEFFEQQRTTIEATKAIQRRLTTEGLDLVLDQKKQEGDRLVEESKQEKEKLQAFKLAINKCRTERCSKAQQLADLTKEQDAARREGETQTKELLTKLSAHTESTERRQSELDETKSKLDKTMADIQEQLSQEMLLKSLAETKSTLEEEQQRKDELLRLEAELVAKLKTSQEELEGTEEVLKTAKQSESEARTLKAENDENHSKILVPGRVELSEIAEKKEVLSKLIEESQKSNSELEISDKEYLDSKLETKRAVLEDLEALKEEEKSATAKKESMQLANKQSKESWEREIQEHIIHERKLCAATETKLSHLEDVRQAQSNRREESVDECIKLAENEKAKGGRLVKILKRGVDVIQEAESRLGKLGKQLEW